MHLTPRLSLQKDKGWLLNFVKSPEKVAYHAFFPLLHRKIYQRRYKVVGKDSKGDTQRGHTKLEANGQVKSTRKERPIHYPTHLDSQIYAYYASEKLQKPYEVWLSEHPGISNCVSAYRRVPDEIKKGNKSNIHFARDVFEHIRSVGNCCALAFDIESFFNSLDHRHLKHAWCKLLGTKSLPPDHYNVFKSVTQFSYVLRDEFRQDSNPHKAFNEKELARLRQKGIHAFFESGKSFKEAFERGDFIIRKTVKKGKEDVKGIPQGLPISAVLANLYLLEFDERIFEKVVLGLGGLYRRYSDDIVVVCPEKNLKEVKDYVEMSIREFKLEISSGKTEVCFFRFANEKLQPYSLDLKKNTERPGVPFHYLGFEFYGDRVLIKSANVSKFYRRMKESVKKRCRRIEKHSKKMLETEVPLFKRKLFRLFSVLGKTKRPKRIPIWKSELVYNSSSGKIFYQKSHKPVWRKYRGNTLSYAWRAAQILDEPGIKRQFRRHWKILNQYIRLRMSSK